MYFKDMSDAALDETITALRSLAENAVAMKKPYGVGRLLKDLDIAVAVKNSRVRRGVWNPDPAYDEVVADDAAEAAYDAWAADQFADWGGFTPEAEKAYWAYVSQGYADSDGFYRPLTPASWLAGWDPARPGAW